MDMDADICVASRLLMDWDMAYRDTHDDNMSSLRSQSHPHMHSPSSSPSFSSESESYPLSRCSSISSLSSAYSDSDTSDTEDCNNNARFLISILKKPRLLRGGKKQQQLHQGCERRMSHQHDYDSSHSGDNYCNNEAVDKNGDKNELKGDEYMTGNAEDEWQGLDDDDDDESECEIIFERNVTFDDPLATDIMTGVPVAPSSRSRVEWTALKARERLERRRGFLGDLDGEEGDDHVSLDAVEERHEEDLDNEVESEKGAKPREAADEDDVNIEACVLDITEAATQFVELQQLR